nr:reverse transcriptase domain-containing protein [Tanacetum cinerariifolium]
MIDRAIQRNFTHTQEDARQNLGGGPRRPVQPARVCSYTKFMKCQPLNFEGTKGVVGLSCWVEKMESVFHISGCAVENQLKGNDVGGYTQRFQELTLMCTKFFSDETEKVDGAARQWLEKEPLRSILTWEDLVSKFINEFFPPSRITNLRNEISNFQQRFDELFHEACDRYKDLLCACPHHGFTELHHLNTFYNALNPADQDSLNYAAGGNLLERCTQDVLTIIENKSKVRNSQNKSIVSQVKSSDANSNSSSEIAKLTHAVNQQTSVVTTAMTAILKQFQATSPPASVKAVEEIYITCDGAHPYYQCLAADGNTFSELRGNIQGYVAAAAVNYNQGSGSLPSNTIDNPKGELKAITTQSGIVLDGIRTSVPIPPPFINPEEDKCVEETLTDQDLAEYTIKKMLKALLSNKEKLLELANTPFNENCSAVILKKLPEKLGDPRKFLIPCGFSKLKCKALADLGARINFMPLSIWKKLGLPELISTRMTLELANQAICTPDGIARDVFVLVGKFTFPADFIIVDYESDPRVPLILGRSFLQIARALIDVHGEEMILRDEVKDDVFNPEGGNVLPEKLLDLDSTKDLHLPHHVNLLSGNTIPSSSPNQLLKEFADELTLITFPPGNDDLSFDIESNLKEIEYLLHHDPIKEIDTIIKDSIDQSNLADLNDNLVDSMPEMFTDKHALDYSSPSLYDEYDDDLFEVESDSKYVYNDPFDSKGEKIKEPKLLIYELDLPSDFLLPSEYDSFLSEDFSKDDTLPSTNNEDKLAISHASSILKDFNPPLNELPSFKEVLGAKTLFSFSSENEGKNFKPRIHTSKEVYSSLIPELSNQGYNVFKIIKILKGPMKIFLFSSGENIHILDVPCLHFYPP